MAAHEMEYEDEYGQKWLLEFEVERYSPPKRFSPGSVGGADLIYAHSDKKHLTRDDCINLWGKVFVKDIENLVYHECMESIMESIRNWRR